MGNNPNIYERDLRVEFDARRKDQATNYLVRLHVSCLLHYHGLIKQPSSASRVEIDDANAPESNSSLSHNSSTDLG